MPLTASQFTNDLILALAVLSKHRPGKAVAFRKVEAAVLGRTGAENTREVRRRIGFAFRNKRAGYCGKQTPLTQQVKRGQWALTLAGVEYARAVAGCTDDRIVTLNMGLGRDSIAELLLLVEQGLVAEGRRLLIADIDCVVFSNLDAEWDFTYALIPRIRLICAQHGIRFIILEKPPVEAQVLDHAARNAVRATGVKAKFQPDWFKPWAWQKDWTSWADRTWSTIEDRAEAGGYHLRGSIIRDFASRATIASRKGDCTDNHKIHPIRKLVRDLCWEKYDLSCGDWTKLVVQGLRRPHLTLIGIAADEASRTENGGKSPQFITEAYPLVEMGVNKPDEAAILERHGLGHVRKSGCRMCPFQGVAWFAALKALYPAQWEEALAYETLALSRNQKMFVSGSRTLSEQVDRWLARNPDPDWDAVLDKSYSRCSKLRKLERKAS